MIRILRGTPGTLFQTWYEDGAAIDPGAVTITITRADGTDLVTSASTSGTGAAGRTYNFTQAQTNQLDTLTVTWTSATKGTLTDTVEIVGGFLFTVAEAYANDIPTIHTAADIAAMRTTVEQEIEKACGCAFVPRYTRDTLDGPGGPTLTLRPLVTNVRTVTANGTPFTAGDITALSYGSNGTVHSPRPWACGTSNIVVGYEHGYQEPPHGIRRAALILTKSWLGGKRSPIDDRAITFNVAEGGTYSLAVPGRNGSHFGHPDVDSAIDRYSLITGIA